MLLKSRNPHYLQGFQIVGFLRVPDSVHLVGSSNHEDRHFHHSSVAGYGFYCPSICGWGLNANRQGRL